jgi:hypothetical protein
MSFAVLQQGLANPGELPNRSMPELFGRPQSRDDDVGIDGGIERAKQQGRVAETRLFQIASFGGKDALR